MPDEFVSMIVLPILGIYAFVRGIQLFIRTFDPDPSDRWGCGRLASAWFVWLLVCLLAVGLFLPTISCDARGAARRSQCCINIRQIGLALHNYHDRYGCYPPAYTADKNGRSLHSWRVLILPFLEQNALFERIRLDEPYDSPHNREVFNADKPANSDTRCVPNCYYCPSDRENRTDTNYVMLLGPRSISNGTNFVRQKDFTDGVSKTITVAETHGLGIPWYEPRDLRVEQMSFKINDPERAGIASLHDGGAHVGLADGSVHFLLDDTDPRTVEAMTTINGGEAFGKR